MDQPKIYNHYPLTLEDKAALPGKIRKEFFLIVVLITVAGIVLPQVNSYRASLSDYDPLRDVQVYKMIWGFIYGYAIGRLIVMGFYIAEIFTGNDFYSDCLFWSSPKRIRSHRGTLNDQT